MRIQRKIFVLPLLMILIIGCASKSVKYDLPSAGTSTTPKWVDTHRAVRDTIFIVIHLPEEHSLDMEFSVQKAQSELNTMLMSEIEVILRDYWDEKQISYSDEEEFQLISGLPMTLEQIMHHVDVTDGWEKNGEVSILCALDYEEVAEILIQDMEIEDRAFLSYLKRRMDDLAQRYR
ncbi:MAG: hypothetical protein HOB84_12770 [Candidatus Marinimicrobia bacterium]|jgi:hypothetical protein|nr:hypothetical protein [Candidatus Neomarinimicrobiota bacterium]MBT4361964.1 hypothetical protein [Candidatus Neomarinimicrobiota bacterium]MBT4715635.1 hypothetical protein [Candidatus Neomarinimicrobiota bacterium]MBT4947953.1 hypothetical protein [Candidatus Neomarinimicrobiota bacterium]MBT5267818.1 hypothetical protein [Candidatus Neomarinimicrobiota bacterium]